MKSSTKIALAIASALTLGLGAAAVNAHPYGYGPGGGMGSGMGPGYGMHGQGMGPGHGMRGHGMGPGYGMRGYGMGPGGGAFPGAVEGRLAALKSELKITADQESAWQAIVANAKQHAENRQAWFAKMREARVPESAPERLAQRTEIMKQRLAEMENNASAIKNLYAVLTPEQKTIADKWLGGFGPRAGAGYGPGSRGGPGGRFR
ncbi:MAG: Spy/CpxP family protein refolding chaperone [Betaproteobacteria bacterium]|nr:Spy/CpxP family protein refolding chaperone [Betaproteobacteria bacterium]